MERLLLDDLTGAYQRVGLQGLLGGLAREYAEAGSHYALAMLDVDHLKTLNDVYGHATGDAALKAVAERARRVMRADDLLFRYGGDEFLLVLPGTPHDVAEAVARRVRDQVIANPVEAAVWVNVNVSVGVASSDEPGSGGGADELFGRADERLYLAKRVGRNTVVAGDTPLRPVGEGPLRETRLVGCDEPLAALDAFLAAAASEPAQRVLQLRGPAGAGFTRFLNEVEVRAAMAGRVVRRVEAQEADTGVYLRALARAYGETLPPDPAEDEVSERLAADAEAHGLVVLLEGGRWLDAGSRILLGNRLRRGGVKVVEVVQGGAAALPAGASVELAPLSAPQVSEWLTGALGVAVSDSAAQAFTQAGAGLPAHVTRIVNRLARRLKAEGGVVSAEKVANAEPAVVSELAQEESACANVVDLPQWDAPLVGRAQWLNGAKGAVGAARLSVLVGPGGVGKSRLAAQLARELAHEYPGGTHWIDLRAVRDAALVPGLIAEHLGLEQPADVTELAAGLGEQPRLLVFDELDGVADQVGWVSELLDAAPQVRLLATARMPLRLVGETHLNVPELSKASAGELFRRGMLRVGEDQDVSAEQIAELIDKIGRGPLALELAAAWTRSLSLEELAERLAETPVQLPVPSDLAPLTTRFIDVTRELMSDAEREALGTLTLVPSGFTPEVARNAAGASPFFLLALLERSLIRREGQRYTVHAAIAERYRAGLTDLRAAKLRVAHAFADLARGLLGLEGKERNSRGYRVVDAERANLFFALEQLAAAGEQDAVWPLVRLLRGYLDVRGRAKDGFELFRLVQSSLPAGADPELLGWVGETQALYKHQMGEVADAEQRIRKVLELLQPLGATSTAGLAWNTLALILAGTNRLEEARAALEVSADIRGQLDDKVGEAQARGNSAIVLAQMGEHRQALDALRAAETRFREVQHFSGVAVTLVNLVALGRESGLMTVAQRNEQARTASEVAESIGYAAVAQEAAAELATGLEEVGDLVGAESALGRALEWARAGENNAAQTQLEERLERLRSRRHEHTRRLAGGVQQPVSIADDN